MKTLFAAIAMATAVATTASAQEVEVLSAKVECPSEVNIQGFRYRMAASAIEQCKTMAPHVFRVDDMRLGISWVAFAPTSWSPFSPFIEPVARDPADDGKLCLVMLPDRTVREWIVEKGKPCTMTSVGRTYRVYAPAVEGTVVCVMPADYCKFLKDLPAVGRARAERSIALARRTTSIN